MLKSETKEQVDFVVMMTELIRKLFEIKSTMPFTDKVYWHYEQYLVLMRMSGELMRICSPCFLSSSGDLFAGPQILVVSQLRIIGS
jgi:hypothetical protein